jgi:phenylacetate-CoA ligase
VNRTLAKSLFLLIEKWRSEPVKRYLDELKSNQYLPLERIKALQQERLSALLKFTMANNAWYREKYAGLDPLNEFLSLPVLTKPELRENYGRLTSAGYEGKLDLVKTSGSTGQPLKMLRDRTVFGHTLASVYRAHAWYGLDIGAREAMLWGIPASRTNRLKMRLRDLVLNRFREEEYNLDPAVLAAFYKKMVRTRPDYLYGYSSMVYEFAVFCDENRLPVGALGLRGAVCTAESIHDYQRGTMERVFGCSVISEYGSAETGIIAYQCPRGRHHISDDCVYVEILDEDDQPARVGEVGKVTVTVLHSQAYPIIRYQLGDYASLSDAECECGVRLSLLESIVGRTSGVIVTPQGRCFHSIVLYYVMKDYAEKFGGVRQFRVRQTHVDRLEFHLVTGDEFTDAARNWIAEQVRARLGGGIRLEFVIRDRIERAASGKLSDFESDIQADDAMRRSFRAGARESLSGRSPSSEEVSPSDRE